MEQECGSLLARIVPIKEDQGRLWQALMTLLKYSKTGS